MGRYTAVVTERIDRVVRYVVEADSEEAAMVMLSEGETIEEEQISGEEVVDRFIESDLHDLSDPNEHDGNDEGGGYEAQVKRDLNAEYGDHLWIKTDNEDVGCTETSDLRDLSNATWTDEPGNLEPAVR